MSHDSLETIVPLHQGSSEMTLAQLMERGRRDLAAEEVVVEFSRDIIHRLVCPRCSRQEEVFAPVGAIDRQRGKCPICSEGTSEPQMRVVQTLTGYKGEPELAGRALNSLGLPLFDIFTVRSAKSELGYCMAGDASAVLGALEVVTAESGMTKPTKTAPRMSEPGKEASVTAIEPTIKIDSEVTRRIRQHARSHSKTEVCGVLIGEDVNGTINIQASIEALNATQAGTHVTFTQDAWEEIYCVKDDLYPNDRIVGWYHSHPGFGVFLSEHDMFIQQNFFSSPGQVAWVYDPHSDEEGCFGWVSGEVHRLSSLSVIDNNGDGVERTPKRSVASQAEI